MIWATGSGARLDPALTEVLGEYTNDGGTLLLSGQDAEAGITDLDVLSAALYTEIHQPSVTSRALVGDDLLVGLTLQLNGGDSASNQITPSTLLPTGGASALAHYTDGTGAGHIGGLRATTYQGRLIYLGFGIEGIDTATQRTAVLHRLLHWLDDGRLPGAPAAGFPTTGLLDSFNRADGAVGSNWIGATSKYAIQGNRLHNIGGNASTLVWNTNFGADQEVYTTLSTIDAAAAEIDLVLKAQGTGECNLLEVWYQPSQGNAQIWTCHNYGTWQQHGPDISLTLAAGDQFGARARADGTIQVYKNGTSVGTVTVDATWPYRADGGRVGVWLIAAPATVLDDVGGGTLP